MKKLTFIILLGLALTLTACGNKAAVDTGAEVSAITSGESTVSEQATESAEETTATSAAESSQTDTTATPAPQDTTSKKADAPATTASQAPAQSQPATQTPATSSAPPVPTTSSIPAQTDPPKPAFNAQSYYDYAMTYAKSIGLVHLSELDTTEGTAWNAPLNLYASLTDDNMKLGVRASCDRIKRDDSEYFGLYLEKQPDGTSYKLYIMYA